MLFIDQTTAKKIDQDLFKFYSLEQLVEISGLSVAQCIHHFLAGGLESSPLMKRLPTLGNDVTHTHGNRDKPGSRKILVIAGPGNNGADGIVAARYLSIFGYSVSLHCLKTSFVSLINLCIAHGVEILNFLPELKIETDQKMMTNDYDLIVDAVFGFGFHGEIKDPYRGLIDIMRESKKPIFSVDVPSGWPLTEDCPVDSEQLIKPTALVSLTAPKSWIRNRLSLNMTHYLAGRFIPQCIIEKYNIVGRGQSLPYNGSDLYTII